MKDGQGAVGLEVVEMRESFEEGAKAVSLVASHAFSHASLYRASASMIACRRSFSFCNRALRSCRARSVRLRLSIYFILLFYYFIFINPIYHAEM